MYLKLCDAQERVLEALASTRLMKENLPNVVGFDGIINSLEQGRDLIQTIIKEL